jgi:hypothetical protein
MVRHFVIAQLPCQLVWPCHSCSITCCCANARACACAYVHACVLTMRVVDGLACPVLVLALVPVDIAWHGAVASQAL